MAYDNTSFNGDLICDEYDDKNNFMNPQTPVGFFFYHILGDSFDMMADMASKFLNDLNILSCDASSLDKFWGISYNMPRPLLYEGQKADYLFVDNGTTASHNDNWTLTSNMQRTRNDSYTTLSNIGGTSQMAYPISNTTKFSGDITIEWENYATTYQLNYLIIKGTSDVAKTFGALGINKPCNVKITIIGTTCTCYIDSVEKYSYTINRDANNQFGVRLQINPNGNDIKYKDFKIYTGEDKERPLTDEEYRIYLYLLNRRLLTREDIEIAMNAAFGLDDYKIYFSTETHFLKFSDHLNYTPKSSEKSSIEKNDEDESLHFVTDFDNDSTTELIQSNLSEIEEVEEIVNIPYNNWDSEFLTFLEQFISTKGNLRIKEYNL